MKPQKSFCRDDTEAGAHRQFLQFIINMGGRDILNCTKVFELIVPGYS